MGADTIITSNGTTQSHQNSAQTIAAASPAPALNYPVPFQYEGLYDGNGQHLSGIYLPLLRDNVLTEAYHTVKAPRPAWVAVTLNEDAPALALVYMLPLGGVAPVRPDTGLVAIGCG